MPDSSAEPIVRTEGLNKLYPDGNVSALVDVNITIPRGQYLAIMGPSGSGKSTLLNILGALDSPSSGEVYFEGEPLSKMPNFDRLRSEKIGFVFQSFHLLPILSAIENVQIPMFESPLSSRQRAQKAAELLDAVGMAHRADHLPSKLSGGERQRVAIARALANDPVLLLADEPTGNLDTRTGDEILALFDTLNRERGMTCVVITHSQEIADRAQRVLRIRDGRIESDKYNSVPVG